MITPFDCDDLLRSRTISQEWENDSFDLTGWRVAIREIWNWPKILPINWRTDAKKMRQFRDEIKSLCLKGGDCWPGEILPLKSGQSYAIGIYKAGDSNDKQIAVVGLPSTTTQP